MDERYLGIEIGGTKLQIVLGDAEANILDRRREAVAREQGAAGIREQIAGMLEELLACGEVRAVGVGFGGPFDHEGGRVAASHHVEGWNGFALGPWLAERTRLPVAADNDANVAALAEAHKGAGRDARRVFYTNMGSGMGGGMVVDGVLYHGAAPGEAEIGLLCYDPATGANFESRCCGWATDRKVRDHIAARPKGLLARLADGATRGEARFLTPALAEGDPAARAILDETARDIAWALSHATHLFHPDVIVLGGGLSLLGEPLRTAVAEALPAMLSKTYLPAPRVRLTALGEDVVGVGALLLARDKVRR